MDTKLLTKATGWLDTVAAIGTIIGSIAGASSTMLTLAASQHEKKAPSKKEAKKAAKAEKKAAK